MKQDKISAAIDRAMTRSPRAFSPVPFARITAPNCSNPDGLREKVFRSPSTGEIFRYVWNNGWEIYEEVPA